MKYQCNFVNHTSQNRPYRISSSSFMLTRRDCNYVFQGGTDKMIISIQNLNTKTA